MDFQQILPRQQQLKNVKMTVTGKNKDIVNFYIPQDVLNKLNWNAHCRVFLFQNEFTFKVLKVEADIKTSFKLSALKNNRGARLQFKTLNFNFSTWEVTHKIQGETLFLEIN